jgi:CheY-like chemotaxis protein
VLEDESLVAILLEDLLTDLGCEVVGPAASIREALRLADLGGIDFALLDVNLGGEARSFEVAERLRAAGTPFAFVTGYGRDGVRADLRDAPVLTKPVDATALARALGV